MFNLSSRGKVEKGVSVSVDFEHVLKLCVHDNVDRLCEGFGKSYFQSNGSAFQQAVVVRLAQIWREIETKQSVAADVIFPRHVDVFVLECFPCAGKHV